MPTALSTVEEWRTEQLIKLGCTLSQITRINANNIDWHEFAILINNGCSIETAIDILS